MSLLQYLRYSGMVWILYTALLIKFFLLRVVKMQYFCPQTMWVSRLWQGAKIYFKVNATKRSTDTFRLTIPESSLWAIHHSSVSRSDLAKIYKTYTSITRAHNSNNTYKSFNTHNFSFIVRNWGLICSFFEKKIILMNYWINKLCWHKKIPFIALQIFLDSMQKRTK